MSNSVEGKVGYRQHKSCRGQHMFDVALKSAEMVGAIAGPREWNDTREAWLARAARRLGWNYWRTRNVWLKRVELSASEWIHLQAIFDQFKQSAIEREETAHELEVLARNAVEARAQHSAPSGELRRNASKTRPRSVGP